MPPLGDALVKQGAPVSSDVACAQVLDGSGGSVRLGSLWEGTACLLVLLRHFGCVGCAQQVLELLPRLPELALAGVRTVLVGNGSLEQRADFVARHLLEGAPALVLTDPSLGLYRALGLLRSAWATIGPRALVDTARALAAGQPHRAVAGDSTQQGGVLLVDRRSVVRFYRRSRSIADHPPASDLVDVALKLAVDTRSPAVRV
jgi:peroxiredoxin